MTIAARENQAILPMGDDEQQDGRGQVVVGNRNVINNHYHATVNVNRIQQANNPNFGAIHGNITQNVYQTSFPQWGGISVGGIVQPMARDDIFSLLHPLLDASHTRNREVSPPNSACFPGTRESVIKGVHTWAKSSLSSQGDPHIMWIHGFAGCGKSAIAQAVAEQFAEKGQLAASFFFFRGSGDRSTVSKFATTIASQLASTISGTAQRIQAAVRKNPGLLSTATATLTAQFQHLVYEPVNDTVWGRMGTLLRVRPYLIILDGLDECEDRKEISAFIEHMIAFFARKPHTPLRVLITSRVESHIHQRLHSSSQVHLLDLVDHTSDSDIAASLDAAIENEKRSRVLACDRSWPSAEDKAKLVKHIGGSYIFMTTILRLLFDPSLNDGLTPMERLPLVLSKDPDFDSLYREILAPWQHLPHFHSIISTIALAKEPLSISQIGDLMQIETVSVANVLVNLHAIFQIPGDDDTPVTVWHTSLRDFLCAEDRSGSLFASAAHHQRIAYGCIASIAASANAAASPSSRYSRIYAVMHLAELIEPTEDPELFVGGIRGVMSTLEMPAYRGNRTALEVACEGQHWTLVRTLISAGANVNTRFYRLGYLSSAESVPRNSCISGIVTVGTNIRNCRLLPVAPIDQLLASEIAAQSVGPQPTSLIGRRLGMGCALDTACRHEEWELVYLLLERGADPNIASPKKGVVDMGTFLGFTVWKDDLKLATRLLECGANPNLQGGHWGTALRAACAMDRLEMLDLLLSYGADPNQQDTSNGRSPLHMCAWRGYERCARALLMHKADPNVRDKLGNTPLHDACAAGKLDVVKCLLELKADASIANVSGETALKIAQKRKNEEIVQAFRQYERVE